jgi:hypothetical protein
MTRSCENTWSNGWRMAETPSNAAHPFELQDIDKVPLTAKERYEIFRGVTRDNGLTFSWTPVTERQGVTQTASVLDERLYFSFYPPVNLVVVELKFRLSEADRAEHITNALPLRMGRCSKYVLGITLVAARWGI